MWGLEIQRKVMGIHDSQACMVRLITYCMATPDLTQKCLATKPSGNYNTELQALAVQVYTCHTEANQEH